MRKLINKLTNYTLISFIFTLIPLAVLILLTSNTNLVGGIRSFIVLSGSMEPAVSVGSMVFTKKSENYNVGDIITFTNNKNITVTHRIIELIGSDFKVKGDANDFADTESIKLSAVIGRKFIILPKIGYLIHFLKTPIGFMIFIIIPAVLYIVLELISIKREIEKEVEIRVASRIQPNKIIFIHELK